jgi:hypothetical protein
MLPDILQLGPFMIRMDWLILAISGIVGLMLMQWKLKHANLADRLVLDPLINAVIIIIIIWKMSPILLSPTLLQSNPMLWLTMPGVTVGWWLGLVAAGIYLYVNWIKKGASWRLVGDLLMIGIVSAGLTFSLFVWQYGSPTSLPWGISIQNPEFKYHPVNVYRFLVSFPMMLWLLRNGQLLGSGKWLSITLTYYGMGLMVVSFFNNKTNFVFGLSIEQIVYLAAMSLGVGLSVLLTKQTYGKINRR